MNRKELEDLYLKKRIQYMKAGSRKGWRGRVTRCRDEGIKVSYDNGFDQWYHYSAIHNTHDDSEHSGTYSGYLRVTSECDEPGDTAPITCREYAVIDQRGKLVDSFDDEHEALAFATEQVVDSKSFAKFHVFNRMMTVQTKVPDTVVIDSHGEVIGGEKQGASQG